MKSESVRECERVTFVHRHENKSCSACWEWVNERVREWRKYESKRVTCETRHENKSCPACRELVNASFASFKKVWESERVREWLLSIDMKNKFVQHSHENKSYSACRERVNERVRECFGSQLLSDIQTFFVLTIHSQDGRDLRWIITIWKQQGKQNKNKTSMCNVEL